MLKETNSKFSSKLIEQEKHIYSLTTLFEERPEKMSVRNRVVSNIVAAKQEMESTLELKLD